MTGYFYTAYYFMKRRNSTKQPDTADPTKYDSITFVLKNPTSLDNPVILLEGGSFDYVYVYIVEWKTFYYIEQKTMVTNSLMEFALDIDALASYRSAVMNAYGFIEYKYNGYDTMMNDPRLAVYADKYYDKDSGTPGKFSLTGCYILTCVNNQSNTGMSAQYCLSAANFRALATVMFNNTSLIQELKEYCGTVWDSILSCFWVPFTDSEVPGTSTTVFLGKTDTNIPAKLLTDPTVKQDSVVVPISWHYSDFRKSSPYTSIAAWIPGYGYIDINPNDVISCSSLKFEFMLDFSTGDVSCQVVDPVLGTIFQNVSYNVASQISISNYTLNIGGIASNVGGFLGSAASTMASAVSQNWTSVASGALSMVGAGGSAILEANRRAVSSKGSFTGRALIWEGIDVVVTVFSQKTEDPNNATYISVHGRPFGKAGYIGMGSGGYVKCIEASVEISGNMTATSQAEINDYINSGIYAE